MVRRVACHPLTAVSSDATLSIPAPEVHAHFSLAYTTTDRDKPMTRSVNKVLLKALLLSRKSMLVKVGADGAEALFFRHEHAKQILTRKTSFVNAERSKPRNTDVKSN